MTLSLQKKLKSYSVFAGVVMASSHEATAQIIFTDEDPDIHLSMSNLTYYMDLNADGTSDFNFHVHTGNNSYYVYADEHPLASGGGIVADYHAYNFPYGALIGSNIPPSSWDLGLYGYICDWGCSMAGSSAFIAIQMQISGETHYGYVGFERITDQLPGDYVIREFGVNNIPGEAIYSGQLPQPILNNLETNSILYYSMLGDTVITQTLTIEFPETKDLKSATVKIDSGYIVTEDTLEFIDQNGLVGSWDAISGTLSISGNASVSVYQQALQSVQFRNLQVIPTPGVRTIGFAASNGQPFGVPLSETVFRNIEVTLATGTLQPGIASNVIHLTPNPVIENALVEIEGAFLGIIHVQVKDAAGRKLAEQEFLKTSQQTFAAVRMQQLTSGIYFMEIQMDNEKKTVKVVKQ